jgi:hypothetical protein
MHLSISDDLANFDCCIAPIGFDIYYDNYIDFNILYKDILSSYTGENCISKNVLKKVSYYNIFNADSVRSVFYNKNSKLQAKNTIQNVLKNINPKLYKLGKYFPKNNISVPTYAYPFNTRKRFLDLIVNYLDA